MDITRVAVRYGRTYNLGDHNFAKLEYEIEAEVGPDDDLEHVNRELWNEARREINDKANLIAAGSRHMAQQ